MRLGKGDGGMGVGHVVKMMRVSHKRNYVCRHAHTVQYTLVKCVLYISVMLTLHIVGVKIYCTKCQHDCQCASFSPTPGRSIVRQFTGLRSLWA